MLTRPVAAILLVTCIPQLNGCAVRTTQRVPLGEVRLADPAAAMARPSFVSGITTRDGAQVAFDTLSARVTNDSVYATVQGRLYVISLRQVVRILVVRNGETVVTNASALTTVLPRPQENILGVTTVGGRGVEFNRTLRPWVANDTLYATTLQGTSFKIPVRDVRHFWVRRVDVTLSALVTIAVTALALGVFGGFVLYCERHGCQHRGFPRVR